MRTAWIWAGAAGIAGAGVGGIVTWQRAQISELRSQVVAIQESQAKISAALPPPADPVSVAPQPAFSLEDERRLILRRYRNSIARMNLTPEAAARLENVLTASVEEVLQAEETARQAGAAQNSKAVATALGEMDYEVATFMNSMASRPLAVAAEPPPAPAPAAPTVIVVQAPAASAAPAVPVVEATEDTAAVAPLFYSGFGYVGVGVERDRRRRAAEPEKVAVKTTPFGFGGAWLSIPGAGGGRQAGSR